MDCCRGDGGRICRGVRGDGALLAGAGAVAGVFPSCAPLFNFEFEEERFVADSGLDIWVGVEWADLLSRCGYGAFILGILLISAATLDCDASIHNSDSWTRRPPKRAGKS